jgi:hypothetical protein
LISSGLRLVHVLNQCTGKDGSAVKLIWSMPPLCTYVVTKDTGLAPNPLWVGALSVCTPNRQGARLKQGDWIAGFTTKSRGHRLVYAMVVENRIHMQAYFDDPRFAAKKPNLAGSWQERCNCFFLFGSEFFPMPCRQMHSRV